MLYDKLLTKMKLMLTLIKSGFEDNVREAITKLFITR